MRGNVKYFFKHFSSKHTRKGLADGLFAYATTKCLALYVTVLFAVGAWLFARHEVAFILHSVALAFVAILAYIFHFDISWI